MKRKYWRGREQHEDNFEAGVSTSTLADRCGGVAAGVVAFTPNTMLWGLSGRSPWE